MIPFNIPAVVGNEEEYLRDMLKNKKFSGDGTYTNKCNLWFESKFDARKALLTTSCTHALEMAALLINIKEGDEVIIPSYTFVSTANAFVLRGARIVFVDIRPDTMNINEKLIENAITNRTKAIVPVHYAGISCDMDVIMNIAQKYDLYVIEDAAQGVMSKYNEKYLGTVGHLGCFSFHETKNYNCGEGGALIINDERFLERAEIIREKGTNRSRFFRGEVDKYTWVDIGSSYLPSEFNAAFLYGQLVEAELINKDRLNSWNIYFDLLYELGQTDIELPHIPVNCTHNGHMFYIKVKDIEERSSLIDYLKKNGVCAVFHYVPLHSADAGEKYGRFNGHDLFTSQESDRLIRLPLYYGLRESEITIVVELIKSYFSS